nr:hypothetical protein [Tanacetum cinerariifolium]
MGHFAREGRAPRSQERARKESYKQRYKAEEKSSKALMAIDGIGWDWSYMANEEDHALVADRETPSEFTFMANIENKVFDNSLCSKDLTDYSRPSPTVASTSAENQIKDTSTSEDVASTNPPKTFVKFVKPKDSQPESKSKEQETPKKSQVKYPEQNRHLNKRPKANQRNWNNLKSYQLGPEFVLHKKPCFNCGDFSHLANNCRRRVQMETNRSQNYSYKSSTHRSAGHRPTGAHMRPLLRSAGSRPHGDSMRPSFRPTGHRPHGPLMNPRRPTMNKARPYKTFFQTPSYVTRPFLKSSAVKNSFRAPWVPNVNRAVLRTTLMIKGSSQNNIDDKGYWDSGCSRHMIGNISYLSDFEPFDGGYVSFGQGGCKIIECIVFGRNFKLLDDTNILLRTLRQHNMYSIDLNNIVPHKDLTCLVAKASADECILWHRRLGHLNVKTMNKLVRHNLVRGLPTKSFDNDLTCNACPKGKQHKASYKSKLVNSVTKPLHTLHMDLFGPTSVSSISHKWYCLVVTDDFLGIKRELSNARTPHQNGVAERRNRTLIEAARTMLADAKLPVTFWAEAVNTAYNLEKFEAKGDEGYFIGYSMSSKAFRVFNKRTRRVEENLHVEFLENKAIEKGAGPLFNIDSLTKSINYVPVDAGSGNPNPTASSSNPPANQMETLTMESPIPTVSSPVPAACLNDSPKPSSEARFISKRVANKE